MLKYAAGRIVAFIPTLVIISLMAFIISINAPGDPVEKLLRAADKEGSTSESISSTEQARERLRHELGLDKPVFYMSFSSLAQSDTLYRVSDREQKSNLAKLTKHYGNWPEVRDYYVTLQKARIAHTKIDIDKILEKHSTIELVEKTDSSGLSYTDTVVHYDYSRNTVNDHRNQSNIEVINLLQEDDPEVISVKFANLDTLYDTVPYLQPAAEAFVKVKEAYNKMQNNSTKWKSYVPWMHFYGLNNQYHTWLFGNRPWITKRKSLKKESGQLLTDASFSLNIPDTAYHEVRVKLKLHHPDSLALSRGGIFQVRIGTVAKTYTLDQLFDLRNKVGYAYQEKYYLKGGDDVAINLINLAERDHPNSGVSFDYALSVSSVGNFNPEKLSGGLFRGDFGKSYKDGQPIATKLRDRLRWSMLLAFFGLTIAYVVSIPIGIYAAYRKDGLFDRGSSLVLFILYSLPVFFVGTWLLYEFANPDHFVWFPEGGIQDPSQFNAREAGFWEEVTHRAKYFVLPIITYTYGSFAYLSRIMRVGMVEVFGQDYIRTARAKGLSEKSVVLKHALRNSLIPIITVFGNIFPVAIGGSVIIEMIFSIPGMGVMILDAVIDQDYPVIVTVFTILGFLTMIGYLVSDILYGVADPRISYH